MIDFKTLPDLIAITLLTFAFASVARRNDHPGSGLWLVGWCMILLHFTAQLFAPLAGWQGDFFTWGTLASLTWAGALFMRATVPCRQEASSLWISASYIFSNSFYIATLLDWNHWPWLRVLAAASFAVLPLVIVYSQPRRKQHRMRWIFTAQNCILAILLLILEQLPGDQDNIALHALLFSAFFGCCLHVAHAYRKLTTGTFITQAGFFSWSLVFVVAPLLHQHLPQMQVESEVWNLPKYVVAVGMILLVLERQVEHNEYLALHDDLTGLPNRRLFQDRLQTALERAKRRRQHMALLLIDLNRFKQVNDEYGHHMGDLLLKRIGAIFQSRIRASDTVARTGGDEFAVILEEPISRTDAEHVALILCERLEEPILLGDCTVQSGASIGVALYPEDASTPETLAIAADQRMYDVKHRRGQMQEDSLALLTNELG